jgi:hypothetical protein
MRRAVQFDTGMELLVRRGRLLSVVGATAVVFATVCMPAQSAARPRAGGTCLTRETGIVFGRGDAQLMCLGIRLCSGRKRQIYVPLKADEVFPADSVLRRYGECARPVPTTTIRPFVEGSGEGAACLRGAWTLSADAIKSYLTQVTGMVGEDFAPFNGTLTMSIAGGSLSDLGLAGADMVGSGQMRSASPDGAVKVTIAPALAAKIDATNNEMSGRAISALFTYDITVNGTRVDLASKDLSGTGAGTTTAFECTGSMLRFRVVANGRTAYLVFTR